MSTIQDILDINQLPLHQLITHAMPKSVSEVGMDSIRQLLAHQKGVSLPDDWDADWIVTKSEYAGTMPKRIASWAYKTRKLKLESTLLSEIGNVARSNSPSDNLYRFDFDRDLDWQAGDFGDAPSCFWQSHCGARDLLREANARAIRFFNEAGRGYARAWLVQCENNQGTPFYALFNGYGLTAITIARVFSDWAGLTYKKVGLYNNGDTEGELWINSGTGYAVFETGAAIGASVDLDLDDSAYRSESCVCCGELIEGDVFRNNEDDPYHQDCYYERYVICNQCGLEARRDDSYYVNGPAETWCERCFSRGGGTCDDCGEHFRREACTAVAGANAYCANCLDDNAHQCEHCKNWFSDSLNTVHQPNNESQEFCNECAQTEAWLCAECGDHFGNAISSEGVDGALVCADCGVGVREA